MQRETLSPKFPLGSEIPSFSLPSTDGRTISDSYFRDSTVSVTGAAVSLVVFTCNHCPYVKGSEAGMLETFTKYGARGVKIVLISSNDAVQYPDDGFPQMKARAESWKAALNGVDLPYLYDESQTVAKAFDAACTPECYLFVGGKLAFHGAPNSSPKDPSTPRTEFLRTALEQATTGRPISPPYCHPIGCSIKWKS